MIAHTSPPQLQETNWYVLYRNERPGNSKIENVDFGNLTEEEKRKMKVGGGVLLAVKKTVTSYISGW